MGDYCSAEQCFVHLYCTRCTQCSKVFCNEHIPLANHRCASNGVDASERPPLTGRMASNSSGRSSYRRTRSREMMEQNATAGGGGASGETSGGELASPLLRRNSSMLSGRGSNSLLGGVGSVSNNGLLPAFSRTPSGPGGPSGSLPRGLSAMMYSSPGAEGGAESMPMGDLFTRNSSYLPSTGGEPAMADFQSPRIGGSMGSPLQQQQPAPEMKLTRLRSRELSLGAAPSLMRPERNDSEERLTGGRAGPPLARQGSKRKSFQSHPTLLQQQPMLESPEPVESQTPPVMSQITPRARRKSKAAKIEEEEQEQARATLLQVSPPLDDRVSPPMDSRWPLYLAAASAQPASAASQYNLFSSSMPSTAVPLTYESPAPLSISSAYESETARMLQVTRLLAHWVPSHMSASSSSASSAVQAETDAADELVRAFQQAQCSFRRDVLECVDGGGGGASPVAFDALVPPAHVARRRLRMCEAIVSLSLTHTERLSADGPSTANSRSHSPSMGGSSAHAGSRIPILHHHPLLSVLSRCLVHVVDTLLLNALEVAVFSLYLDRLCGSWSTQIERGPGAAALPSDVHNVRVLHYVAFMAKLALSDSPSSGSANDPLLAYLTGLWPDFTAGFSTWLHFKGATHINTPPIQLNQRFIAITAADAASEGSRR